MSVISQCFYSHLKQMLQHLTNTSGHFSSCHWWGHIYSGVSPCEHHCCSVRQSVRNVMLQTFIQSFYFILIYILTVSTKIYFVFFFLVMIIIQKVIVLRSCCFFRLGILLMLYLNSLCILKQRCKMLRDA